MEGKKNSQNVFFPPPSKLLCRCSQCKNNADLFFYYYYFFGEVCVVTCCLTFDCNRSQCYLVTIHHLSILQLENLFFFYFRLECVVFFLSLVLCLCLESVGERNIDQVFFALDQWRCPNRDERVGWVFPLVSLDVY